jgi:hypothetical protein
VKVVDKKFEKHLQKLEDLNYALPENATDLERAKYELCQSILAYTKQDRNLSTESIAIKLKLSIPETKKCF